MSAGNGVTYASAAPNQPANLIQVQSKMQQQQQQQTQQQSQQQPYPSNQQQHAQPPGMLADEPSPPAGPKRPSAIIIQTNNANKTNPTFLTPQQQQQQQILQFQQQQLQQYPALQEQSLSESYYSDKDGDGESSDDESPRENRVLTFADEHGKNLVAVHWYEPDPGEDNRAVVAHPTTVTITEEIVETGCGSKCVIL